MRFWGFIQKKEGHKLPEEANNETIGDAYCFLAMERRTKLVLNFVLGRRNQATTDIFIEGLLAATSPQEFQITTDGFTPYRSAIDNTLSDRVDFAQLIKVYRANPQGEHRYSPADVVAMEVVPVPGNPDPKRICTSHIERQNLHHADADSPTDPTDERLLEEVGEPLGGALPALRLLQLPPGSPDIAGDACDGGWGCGSHLDDQ